MTRYSDTEFRAQSIYGEAVLIFLMATNFAPEGKGASRDMGFKFRTTPFPASGGASCELPSSNRRRCCVGVATKLPMPPLPLLTSRLGVLGSGGDDDSSARALLPPVVVSFDDVDCASCSCNPAHRPGLAAWPRNKYLHDTFCF